MTNLKHALFCSLLLTFGLSAFASGPDRLEYFNPQATLNLLASDSEESLLYDLRRLKNCEKKWFTVTLVTCMNTRTSEVIAKADLWIKKLRSLFIKSRPMDSLADSKIEAAKKAIDTCRSIDVLCQITKKGEVIDIQTSTINELLTALGGEPNSPLMTAFLNWSN